MIATLSGIIAAGLTLVALGAWLGVRRFAALAAGMFVGSVAAPTLGPRVAGAVARLTGYDAWAGDAACWLATYAAAMLMVSMFAARAMRRPALAAADPAGRRRSRLAGAATGAAAAMLLGWALLGELPAGAWRSVAAASGKNSIITDDATDGYEVRRPLALLRACQILRSLSDDEAQRLVDRPDVQAVLQSESLARLLRTPGMTRKFARAADGDWLALGRLAADPTVKAAMNHPEFLEHVQAVDLVALAADVEQQRRTIPAPTQTGRVSANLPEYARDPELRRRLVAEWHSEERHAEGLQERVVAEADGSSTLHGGEAFTPDAYWRTVETGLHLLSGPGKLLQRRLPVGTDEHEVESTSQP